MALHSISRLPAIERFLLSFIPVTESGCWLWIGACERDGYAKIVVNKKRRSAHRYAYELFIGPIPHGLQLDHLCRVRCCVNPAHLEPVTGSENVMRGNGPETARHRLL